MSDDCLFCRIVAGEIKGNIVFESTEVLGFKDVNPQAPVHVLFIPKRHVSGIHEAQKPGLVPIEALFIAANETAKKMDIAESGYRLVINCNKDGGQTVGHLHLHLIGGRQMTWPPG